MSRGTKRKRSKDSYEIRVDIGRDPATGKRRFDYFTVRGTEADAERARTEALYQRDTGIDVSPSRITCEGFLDR